MNFVTHVVACISLGLLLAMNVTEKNHYAETTVRLSKLEKALTPENFVCGGYEHGTPYCVNPKGVK